MHGNLQLLLGVFQIDLASVQAVKLDRITSTLVSLGQKVDDSHSKEEFRKIHLWLDAPDTKANHPVARQKHEPRTGSWFVDSDRFSDWLHGLRKSFFVSCGLKSFRTHADVAGCGKTILRYLVH